MDFEKFVAVGADRLNALFSGHVISGLSDETRYIGIALAYLVLFFLLSLIAVRLDRKSSSFVFLFASLLLFYLFTPFQIQVRWVPERTTIYLFLFAFLAISMLLTSSRNSLNFKPDILIAVCATMLVIYSSIQHSLNHLRVNEYYAEYMAGLEKVKPYSTILALRVVSPVPDKVGSHLLHKLLQGGSYYAVLRNSVDVKLFQAKTKVVPIVYRDSKNPYKHWIKDRDLVDLVPRVDFEKFSNVSEKPLDYVLLWGDLQEAMRYKELIVPLNRLFSELDKEFDHIGTSSPLGYMNLFENKTHSKSAVKYDISSPSPAD